MRLPLEDEDGCTLAVRLTPRAKRNQLAGVVPDGDRVALAAPPVEGAANKALTLFIAEGLGVPRSAVSILSGETSRLKMVRIVGDPLAIRAKLLGWTNEA